MSTSMGTTGGREQVTYGNLRRPALPGLGKLSAGASVVLVGGAAMLMLLALFDLWLAVAWAGLLVAVLVPELVPTRDGYSRYAVIARRVRFRAAERAGHTMLSQGLTGNVPDGQCALPGAAASSELSSQEDAHGRAYGLVSWPAVNLHSVVLQTYPPGLGGLEKSVVDSQVAHWGAWLGQLGSMPDVVGASVVVETAPDSGKRLARAMGRGTVDDAPVFAEAVADQIQSEYRVGSPVLATWITLTFTGRADREVDQGKARTITEMADHIGDLLPTLTGTLDQTGTGTGSRPCTAQDITDHTRVDFDPAVAALVEEAQYGDGTGLTWDQAGPLNARNAYDFYEHDGAVSRTWQMREPPRGAFFAQTLQRLLAPHKDVTRKRVTLLYRPESPEVSAAAAERDVKAARFRASQTRHAAARSTLELAAAEKTAEQEALGSPLVRAGMLVTITVLDPALLRRASRAVLSGLAAQARLRMRLPKGAQDVSFLAALPLGMVLSAHARVSDAIREAA